MRLALLRDFLVTILCWAWFIGGFLFFFSWLYLAAAALSKDQQTSFQKLNSRYYRILFAIIRTTASGHTWKIDDKVRAIRSSVVICNHLSYLDPLLMIALFEKHRTIVKTRFFRMPIFGWVIRKSGYFPASGEGHDTRLMLDQMETMEQFLQEGGNLFVFPEGTRSRDGRITNLNRGALKIARMCRAPVYALQLTNTDKLFTPGRFLFNSGIRNTITLKILGRIEPDYKNNMPSVAMLEEQVINIYSEQT